MVAVRKVMAPAPHLFPVKRLAKETFEVSFLRSDSRCRRYVSDPSSVIKIFLCCLEKQWIARHIDNQWLTGGKKTTPF